MVREDEPIEIPSEGQPGLTRTCKAIRAETVKMYYASNIFALSPATPDRALKKLEQWLARIGIENCKFLQKVVITLNKDTGLLVDHLEENRDPWVSLVAVMKATGCMPHLQLELRLHENMRPPPAVLESMSGLFSDFENDAIRELVEIRRAMAHTRLTSYLQVLQWRERNPDTFHQWESSEIPEFVTTVRQSTNERDCTYNWNKRGHAAPSGGL